MSRPRYAMVLKGNQIDGDASNCTGEQIAVVMDAIGRTATACVWFGSDVESTSGQSFAIPIERNIPAFIGDTDSATTFVREVDQFIWAVFLFVPTTRLPSHWPEMRAEGVGAEWFRDIGDAVVEVRAFDSSALMIFAICEKYLIELRERFGGIVTVSETFQSW